MVADTVRDGPRRELELQSKLNNRRRGLHLPQQADAYRAVSGKRAMRKFIRELIEHCKKVIDTVTARLLNAGNTAATALWLGLMTGLGLALSGPVYDVLFGIFIR
jgi:hypothetical protein